MKQFITVTSPNPRDSFFTENGDWAVCRDKLTKYFELDDKPKELTFCLSTEPSEQSYPVSIAADGWMHIHLTKGGNVREAKTGFTHNLFHQFNAKLNRSRTAIIYISVV